MDQTSKEKLLRMVEQNLAKEGQEIRLELGPDEASADNSECCMVAGTVRTVVEDRVRVK